MLVTVTLQCSVLLMVTVTLQCSVLLMVTVTLQCSVLPYGHGHSAVFSAPYGHCHSAVLSPLWSLSLCLLPPLCSGNDRPRSSYGLTSKRCSTASHSCHLNTVLYPTSYSDCQLPLNHSLHVIRGAASSVQQ